MIRARSRSMRLSITMALALAACGQPEPRFAEVTVSAAAPSATLSGSTHGVTPAIELSPGCPGYLDPGAPEHVVHLADATAIRIAARSNRGPLAIAVSGEGEVRCDSDSGSGHAPSVTIDAPGDYAIHVATLAEPGDLPYELVIAPAANDPGTSTRTDDQVQVSVTVTSDPPGATVRTPEGRALGTTPAMFALTIAPSEVGQERRFVLEMAGRQSAEVAGRMIGGAVVLHAALPSAGGSELGWPPRNDTPQAPSGPELVVSAASAQPIRDYQVARQHLEVGSECTIARAAVDVNIAHSFIGDLRVVLRSPRGTSITLHNHGGGGRANLVTSWDWDARRGALQTLAGESARGRWEMAVHDDAGADTGTFRSFTLHFQCREGTVASATSTMRQDTATAPPSPVPDRSAAGAAVASGAAAGSSAGGPAATGARRRVRRPPPLPGATVLDPWSSPGVQQQPPHPPRVTLPPPQAVPPPQGRRNPGSGTAPPQPIQ
jgi:subtilisin-like proprotein convertase family protein